MLSQSLTWFLLSKLYTNAVKGSVIINAIMRFFDWISRCVKNSGIYLWLGSDLFTEKYYETSYFYKALNWVWINILKIIAKIQSKVRKLFADSFSLYCFDKIISYNKISVDIIFALFIGVMFILPHERWNNLYFVIGMLGFALWLILKTASRKMQVLNLKEFGVAIVAFVVSIAISTVTAIVMSDAIRFALFLTASVICAYSVYLMLDTKEKFVRFIKIILFFVTITGIYAIFQRIKGVEVNLEFVDIQTNSGMPGRVFSTFSNPNNFAQLLLLFMPFFVPVLFSLKRKRDIAIIFGGFGICLAALLMTYSRSCWVGFALAAIVFVCIYDKRLIIPMAFVAILAVPFLPETIMNRIFTIGSMEDSSNSYRIYIWKSCFNMIKDFGLTGLGLGPESFKTMYTGYSSPAAITAPHSHMLYMQIILEMGVIGAVSFFAYIFAVVKKAAGGMRKMSREIKCYACAAISALAGIAFVCCAEYIWFYPRVMFAFWIIPGFFNGINKI